MSQKARERTRQAARIETLIQEVAAFPDPHARATTEELVQTLVDMYGEGLTRLLELTAETEASGLALIDTFASDELLSSLFLLHGLHPLDIEERVMQALDEVRPYLKSHGGNVELVKVEESIAHLRLQGSCNGCPGSTITLKLAIEEAIYKAAPDLEGLQVEGVTDPPPPPPRPGKPITFVPPKRHKEIISSLHQDSGWKIVEGLQSLADGTLKVITIQKKAVLFSQIAGTYYAYHNHCSNCNAPLDESRLVGTTLSCSSCGQQYDICHAGRSLDTSTLFLEAIPLLIEGDKVKVALAVLTKDDQAQATLPAHAR